MISPTGQNQADQSERQQSHNLVVGDTRGNQLRRKELTGRLPDCCGTAGTFPIFALPISLARAVAEGLDQVRWFLAGNIGLKELRFRGRKWVPAGANL